MSTHSVNLPQEHPMEAMMTDPKELSTLDPLLTRNDLEAILQVGERTIRRLVATGQFPRPIRLGGTLRWRKEEVRAFLERVPAKESAMAAVESPLAPSAESTQ
jgi:predicted DNA-binding transcriptional regulator AlpA